MPASTCALPGLNPVQSTAAAPDELIVTHRDKSGLSVGGLPAPPPDTRRCRRRSVTPQLDARRTTRPVGNRQQSNRQSTEAASHEGDREDSGTVHRPASCCISNALHRRSDRIPVFTDGEPEITPTQLPCEALVHLTGYDYSINSAMLIPGSDETPEYCEVKGQILPEVAFELRLPTWWNQRFLMLGNGGFAGWMPGGLEGAVRHFFAVAGTNTGHVVPQKTERWASFAADRQKPIDFAYRAVHATTMTAEEILGLYYVGSRHAPNTDTTSDATKSILGGVAGFLQCALRMLFLIRLGPPVHYHQVGDRGN